MKEITRIHIAKNPYDIEIDAKKALQKYINRLESYTDDAELLEDVEIRVTELLAERGIDANGVITSEDVTAIRTQLGEPKNSLKKETLQSEKTCVSKAMSHLESYTAIRTRRSLVVL
jgi:translation elongation factor EF-Tu-like GTPase